MNLVECVPNFSEGRRPEVIRAIGAAAEAIPNVYLLDQHTDPAHNRTVLTLAGPGEAVSEAAFRAVARSVELIDLRQHQGEHPRIGAADVVPFVPLGATTMSECVQLARSLGERIGRELELPVYLYYEAATRPERRWLPTIRRGGYEGLARTIAADPERRPDFGPSRLGPAGATVVGARPFLVAYNVNLATGDLRVAQAIARATRESGGGFRAVQARAMRTRNPEVVQVSMNLLDISVTPAHTVYAAISQRAEAAGVRVLGAELVGLAPTAVLAAAAGQAIGIPDLDASRVVEARLLEMLPGDGPS